MELTDVRAVLLDMDGTLVDSDAAVERAWRAWARDYGVDLDGAAAQLHGSPAEVTVHRLRPDLNEAGVTAAAARQLALQYEDTSDVTATPGAAGLLAELTRLGLPWAVVTSADAKLATIRLAAAGLAVPVLITVEDVRAGKPDPEGYLLAARRLWVDPGHCLVVEDAAPGVAAGRAAGALVAGLKGVPADLQLDDLRQLVRLLKTARPGFRPGARPDG